MADFLLVDISNSFTKFALSSSKKIGRVHRVPTRGLNISVFEAFNAETVVISSVVPARAKLLLKGFKARRVLSVSAKLDLGVGIDYPNPETIGADRLANAASAVALYGVPTVVVDFGTAVTFDILASVRAGGAYVGGVIAPGLEVMTDYLYQRTALLPKIDLLEPVSAIGKSTHAAMMAGAVFGYRGLVAEILQQIRKELGMGKRLKVVATGGYAQLIADKLPAIDHVHPNLTLEGLRIIGTLNS